MQIVFNSLRCKLKAFSHNHRIGYISAQFTAENSAILLIKNSNDVIFTDHELCILV